jgi:TolB-like protein
MSFFEELKRRNVFRVGIAYAITSWLLLQLSDILVPLLNLPESAQRLILLLLVIGFIPALIFAWAFEMTPEGIKKEKDVDRSQSITSQTGRKLDRTIIVILTLALVYFAFDKFMPGSSAPVEQAAVETEAISEQTPDPQSTQKSIAVLPFVNMSSDPEQEYFSDGISEEILNALAKIHELKVAGRTSSFAFKGQNKDLRLIGETLGVNHILEGSVRKAGERVRITAQLIKVDDGFHMWSETYDRELTDIFAIQDEIAASILAQTKIQLLDAKAITSTRANTLAYDLYLLAKQKIRERNNDQLEAAGILLDRAIEADPLFAPAYAQRGITHILLSDRQYGNIPDAKALKEAKVWLDKAMELDANLAESWAGLGLYWESHRLEREKAIAPLKRALEINPNLINATNWLASALDSQGEIRKAAQIRAQMIELDPLYRPGLQNANRSFNIMGQTEKARAAIDRARPFYPNDVIIDSLEGQQLLWESRIGEGILFAEAAWKQRPNDRQMRFIYTIHLLSSHQFERAESVADPSWRVVALARLGRTEEAQILARELASTGESFGALLNFLGRSERFEELIEFVESSWPDLEAWEMDFPNRSGFGNDDLALIAHAYQSTGNMTKFNDAMARLKASLEHQRSEGADNYLLMRSESFYHMLAGEEDLALDRLQQAADKGWTPFSPRLTDGMPVFKPLEGDSRYEAIQQQMLDYLNAERAKLELEPVELDRTT